MPTIGAPLHKWTAFLLLCSTPTAFSQATNSNVTSNAGATAASSVTQHAASAVPSQSAPLTRSLADTDTICLYRTINYITHTLPQQCLKTSWSAALAAVSTSDIRPAVDPTATPPISVSTTIEGDEYRTDETSGSPASIPTSAAEGADSGEEATGSGTASPEPDNELETDSPFDNANFLSFDEWKKRNLAQVGQSPENVGQGRPASAEQGPRRRPVNVNALDSLGEEAEIDIDFSGFGDPSEGSSMSSDVAPRASGAESGKPTPDPDKAGSGSWTLSKDAGKTCKERFNYASFDCAATILKTNKKAKGSSSVLSEHKDSYMLNECSVDNKFLIVELCDDILVDTVVLANYEFFSSMFRHFRVSVSDRYPVKMERWRTLATFEARNSRDIQPFLITEPQIWARYLRVEFLTHYGNEFYCPLSLLRVHGTTMMEQFRREEEEARGGDDDVDLAEEEQDVVKAADGSGPIPADQVPIILNKEKTTDLSEIVHSESTPLVVSESALPVSSDNDPPPVTSDTMSAPAQTSAPAGSSDSTEATHSDYSVKNASYHQSSSTTSEVSHARSSELPAQEPTIRDTTATPHLNKASASPQTSAPTGSAVKSGASTVSNKPRPPPRGPDAASPPASGSAAKPPSNNATANQSAASPPRPSSTQPNPAVPSTQESFFKSIHKRLQYLEANSTLSLQYIEEQSRILRDAFIKVEKKQLAKTEKFLEYMNSTVISELKHYRNLYEQLWQGTVIEIEGIKERQKSEMGEIGARLSMLADELVWQKRMAVVQSTLLLLCLGLVLFARSGTMGAAADIPIVQQLGTKYSSFFDSPPQRGLETGVDRRRRTFKNMWRSDTSAGLSDRSGAERQDHNVSSDIDSDDARSPIQLEYSPPTPITPGISVNGFQSDSSPLIVNNVSGSDSETGPTTQRKIPEISLEDQAKRIQVLATQSGPATPNGTRDSRPSWEEVDRAMDQLNADEQDHVVTQKEVRVKGKARSPLRRAQSSFETRADENSSFDSGSELFASN